jgi:nitrate reductase gamma subunit
VLKAEGVGTIFFLSANGEEEFISAAAAANWTPHVFLLGSLARRDLVKMVPLSFKDHVFIAFPSVPGPDKSH